MTFDDDVKLFGLLCRYSEQDEQDELKQQIINYVRAQTHDVNTEIAEFQAESATQDSGAQEEPQVFDVSTFVLFQVTKCVLPLQMGSPEDQMLSMHKRKRMARLMQHT